jgi:hypothetical protein
MFNVPKDCSHTNQTADPSVGCHARSTIVPPPHVCAAPPAKWPTLTTCVHRWPAPRIG